jgi:tetratricopeptide (TPR) repeat protein
LEAITYLNKGLASTKTTKKQKALSYATLGNVYYRIGDYVAAKSAYDSSSMLAKYAPNDSTVDIAIHRSNVLGSVTEPYLAIRTQDSLLSLAALSEKDQRSEVRKYIKVLEKQRLDSIYNAENAGVNNVSQNDDVNAGNSGWYFANATQMKKGQSEFKRVWGNRPAVDNWRRSSAIGSVNNNSSNNTVVESDGNENMEFDENGLPTEQSLLAMIPNSPDKQEKANKIIQKAYVDLGDAYIMQLEDYPLALNSLDTLNIRYKAHDQKERELYLRYVMALRQSRIPDAQKYSAQLLQQFPTSQYATLVKPTEDGTNMAGSTGGETVANYYDLTYSLLLQRQYTEVLQRIKTARQKYTNSPYTKRFTVMEGIALAGAGNYVKADTLLRDFIKGNATDTLRPWAEAVLEYVNKNKPATPKVDSSKITPPPLPGSTPNSTTTSNTNVNTKVEIAQPTGEVPNLYSYKPDAEHYCVMSFPGMDVRASIAKKAIADFNAFRYPALRLQDNIDMLSQNEGLVTVQKFASVSQAREYMNALKAATQVFREYQSSEYQLFLVSAVNYQKLLSDHNVKPYLDFYKVNYK